MGVLLMKKAFKIEDLPECDRCKVIPMVLEKKIHIDVLVS